MISLIDTGFLYALIDESDSYNAAVLSVSFLKNLTSIDYELTTPELSDYSRSAEILDKYDDANIDFVDASSWRWPNVSILPRF